jgi:hypothetical protein
MSQITKQTIVNNFEWISNNQVTMDILELQGLKNDFEEISRKLKDSLPDNLIISVNLDELSSYEGSSLYNIFSRLNSIKKNKQTYLPNMLGIYLIEQMEKKN